MHLKWGTNKKGYLFAKKIGCVLSEIVVSVKLIFYIRL